MSRPRKVGLVALLATVAGSGCDWSDSGPPNPLAPSVTTPTIDAGGSEEPGPGNDAGAPRRTVSMRNPLGGPPGNLLYDGDFDLSVGTGNLIGWMVWKSSVGQTSFALETGGWCRSGVRCAVVEPGMQFYGWGAAAANAGVHASIWAKLPESRPCALIEPVVFEWETGMGAYLDPTTEQPAEDGWCYYEAAISKRHTQVVLVVDESLAFGETALLDAARLVPTTGTVPMAAAARPIEPARQQQISTVVEYFRSQRPFVAPVQSGAQLGLR